MTWARPPSRALARWWLGSTPRPARCGRSCRPDSPVPTSARPRCSACAPAPVAVMTGTVRPRPAGGRYASLPAEGFAVDPDLADPTGVLAVTFGDLVSPR